MRNLEQAERSEGIAARLRLQTWFTAQPDDVAPHDPCVAMRDILSELRQDGVLVSGANFAGSGIVNLQ